jgi:hypothetical protein
VILTAKFTVTTFMFDEPKANAVPATPGKR